MPSLTLSLTDAATPWLQQLAVRLNGEGVRHASGGSVARLLQDHFATLDSERANRMGGRRTHFYAQAARGTRYEVRPDGVEVTVHSSGIAQRYFGGTITPVNRKWLTVPARTEAYGKRATEFNNLQFIPFRDNLAALVERAATAISIRRNRRTGATQVVRGRSMGSLVVYWLVKQTQQDADASVLPTPELMQTTARDAAEDYLSRVAADGS